MKNLTLTAEVTVLEAARRRAKAEGTTLEDAIRAWLAEYAGATAQMSRFDATMDPLQGKLSVGRKISRDEMNER